jgi:aspartate carbamoyltransferase catalytic subunit
MEIKDLIRCKDLSRQSAEQILRTARNFQRGSVKLPLFFEQKPTVCLFFAENSTRTKLSFSLAAKRLGCELIDFETTTSSLKKGERLVDTFQCLQAMKVDLCVTRWKENHLEELATQLNMSFVSGGEGMSSHPTQALLDCLTWSEQHESLESKKLLIVGDIVHSRVAASHFELAKILGYEVRIAGPIHWMPADKLDMQVDLEEGLVWADAIMMLRVQKERHEHSVDTEDYNEEYGLNPERLQKIKKEAVILHPGPFNLGVEITEEVLQDPRCVIWKQVENGLYTRMAILKLLLGGELES